MVPSQPPNIMKFNDIAQFEVDILQYEDILFG
jgi:hypothetical protein